MKADPTRKTQRFLIALVMLLTMPFATTTTRAQTSTGWEGDTSSDMQTASNWDNGFGGNRHLFFGQAWHNAGRGGSTTVANASNYDGFRLTFENISGGANQTFTLQGSQVTLFDFGGQTPSVINNSSVNQNINFTGGSGLVLNHGSVNTSLIQVNGGSGGNLTFGGPIVIGGSNNQLRISGASSNTVTFNGVISATAGTHSVVANQGTSGTTTVFNAANTYTGQTFVDSGTLEFGVGGSANSSTIRLGATSGSATAALSLTSATGGQNISSIINPRAGSSGTLTIRSTNSSGTNTLSGHIGLDKAVTVNTSTSGGTLALTNARVGVSTNTGTDIKGFTLTLSAAASSNIVYSGDIYSSSGSGGVTVNGGGTVTLSGVANTYAGGTSLSDSTTLNINHATALGSGALTLSGTGTIDNTTASAVTLSNNNPLTLSGGSLTFTGTRDLNFGTGAVTLSNANRTIGVTNSSATLTLGGVVGQDASARSLTKNGAGTLLLNGANTFSGGTVVIAGSVGIGNNGALGAGTLSLGGTSANTPTIFASGGARTISNNVLLLATSGGGNPTISGSNDLTIGGSVTNSGASRTLTVSNSGSTTLSGNVYLSETAGTGRTLTVNGTGNVAVSGVIANFDGSGTAGNLTYSGGGTMTLSNANTYTGTTTISGGALNAAAANALGGTSNVTINTGGTLLLSNTGTTDRINNAATITMAGGTIAISGNVTEGSSPGTGALTLTANSIIDFANGDGTLKFGDSHAVSWTGTTLSIYNWMSGSDHLFFGDFDHVWNGSNGGLIGSQLAQISFYSDSGTTFLGAAEFISGGSGEVAPVPEPGTLAAAIGLLGLAVWGDRRRSRCTRPADSPAI